MRGVSWTRSWGKLNQNKHLPQKRTIAEWNVGIFTLAWTYSKLFKSAVNTSNHWCMRKWRSRPTFPWENLSDFWIRWKHMFLSCFRLSSDFWKREYLHNVTFWKRTLVTKLEKCRLVFLLLGHFFLFSKIPLQPPIMSPIVTINGCYIWMSFCQWSSQQGT